MGVKWGYIGIIWGYIGLYGGYIGGCIGMIWGLYRGYTGVVLGLISCYIVKRQRASELVWQDLPRTWCASLH